MNLKLVSKTLPNRYAEQLYKNERSINKDIVKQIERIKLDYIRNCQLLDINSHIFLNKTKQKRFQWKKDDLKYRENYKLVCRNTFMRYLNKIESLNDEAEALVETKYDKTKQQRQQQSLKLPLIQTKSVSVDALDSLRPPINPYFQKRKPIDPNPPFSYGAYSTCDKEFLEKWPDLVELTVTNVGRDYLQNKRKENRIIKKQKQKFEKIQTEALDDNRYKKLLTSLIP